MATLITSIGACASYMTSTVQRTQKEWRIPTRRECHSGYDHEGQQRLGISRGGTAQIGAYACGGGGRAGSGTGVLCGGYAGYAELGDGGGRGWRVWYEIVLAGTD